MLSPVRVIFILIFSSDLTLVSGEVGFSLSKAGDQHETFRPDVGAPLCVHGQTAVSPCSHGSDPGESDAPASPPQQLPPEPLNPERPHLTTFRFGLYLQVLSRNFHTWFHKHMSVHIPALGSEIFNALLENSPLPYLVPHHRQIIFIGISLCLRKWGCFMLWHLYWASSASPMNSRILRPYEMSLLSLVSQRWQLPVRIRSQKPSGLGGTLEVFYHL